jgi:hypothetical protein
MEIIIKARGGPATGKTFILRKINEYLRMFGFVQVSQYESEIDEERLVVHREDDRVNFIIGDKMIQLGDWFVELDEHNKLVAVYHNDMDMFAREAEVSFAAGQITTISIKSIVKKDQEKMDVVDPEDVI